MTELGEEKPLAGSAQPPALGPGLIAKHFVIPLRTFERFNLHVCWCAIYLR